MMRNKKGKYITKEGDKGNKGASVKKNRRHKEIESIQR